MKVTATVLLGVVLCAAAWNPAAALTIAEHPALEEFVARMERKHNFTRAELEAVFRNVTLRPAVLEAIRRPAESLPWHRYRKIFLTEANVAGGVKFWSDHRATLARMEKKFGVPPEVVVAIIGVETRYGENKGAIPVLDSLATLALRYPKRAAFFTAELEQFLVLCREENFTPQSLRGSYAGAMGIPQFISSSYRNYAVDFNGDGRRDLLGEPADAIGSVGNYLSRHRWRAGFPVALPVSVTEGVEPGDGLQPQLTVAQLRGRGVQLDADIGLDQHKAMLVELELEDASEHWIGLENFFVITRYNRSKLYAMAVHRLSRRIAERWRAAQ